MVDGFVIADRRLDLLVMELSKNVPFGIQTSKWYYGIPGYTDGIYIHSPDLKELAGDAYPNFYTGHEGFGNIGIGMKPKNGFYKLDVQFYFGKGWKDHGGKKARVGPNNNPDPIVKELADEFAQKFGFEVEHRFWRDKYSWSWARRTEKFRTLKKLREMAVTYTVGYMDLLSHRSPPKQEAQVALVS